MNYQDYLSEAKRAANALRSDILRDVLEYGNNLDDSIESHVWQLADNLCIYTADVRDVVRALEDEHMLDYYTDLVHPEASRDDQNTSIAYEFWLCNIGAAVEELFEAEGVAA